MIPLERKGEIYGMMGIAHEIGERKQAEERLRKSEEEFKAILENMQDIYTRTDIKGNAIMANPYTAELVGLASADELIGKNMAEFLSPEDIEQLMSKLLETGSVKQFETGLICPDRQIIPIEFNARIVFDDKGEPIGLEGVARDITERKQAEEDLRESETRYKSIFNSPFQMAYIVDLSGQVLDTNAYALEHMGYNEEEMAEMSFQAFSHPDDLPNAMEYVTGILAGKKLPPITIRVNKKSGEVLWIESSMIPLRRGEELYALMGLAQDVTERIQSEERLNDLVVRLKASQEELSTPVVQVWDKVLALPLIGVVDSVRAQKIMEVLLQRIVDTQAEIVILDTTGIATMDTQVTTHMVRTIQASSLLGTKCVITGITPEVAQAMTQLDVDMTGLITKRDLQEGLRWALDKRGYKKGISPLG